MITVNHLSKLLHTIICLGNDIGALFQLRTMAMDFWASLDHKLRYKKDLENQDDIADELKKCADVITETDYRMQQLRKMIDGYQF